MREIIKKADVLIEALPYIKAFHGKVVVIKYGGSAMGGDATRRGILEDIVFMHYVGMRPVLVHGGGPEISQRMRTRGKKVEFVDGYRVTDKETVRIVEETFGELSQTLVKELQGFGAKAVSLRGNRDKIIKVKRLIASRDIGFVGEIVWVNPQPVKEILGKGEIPVLSPMGFGSDGATYNVNADAASAEVAGALGSAKLVLLTAAEGILRDRSDEQSLIPTLHVKEVKGLIDRKVIQEGMIPKVQACITALSHGVKKAHIIDARTPHSLLLEIFTDKGIGTEMVA